MEVVARFDGCPFPPRSWVPFRGARGNRFRPRDPWPRARDSGTYDLESVARLRSRRWNGSSATGGGDRTTAVDAGSCASVAGRRRRAGNAAVQAERSDVVRHGRCRGRAEIAEADPVAPGRGAAPGRVDLLDRLVGAHGDAHDDGSVGPAGVVVGDVAVRKDPDRLPVL